MNKTIPSTDIIKISDSLSVVIDRKAEIKVGQHEWYINLYMSPNARTAQRHTEIRHLINHKKDYRFKECAKIIYCIGSPLEGVPQLIQEDEAEELAWEKYNPIQDSPFGRKIVQHVKAKEFIAGFRAAKSKGTFTEEQARIIFDAGMNCGYDPEHDDVKFKRIIHSLTHPTIKEIIVEMEARWKDLGDRGDGKHIYSPGHFKPRYFDPVTNTIKCKFIYQ